jgi:hypothetical protein
VISLCHSCRWMREITSGKGSRFVLCRKSQEDTRFAKYPPQPIGRCAGYEIAASEPVQPPAERDGSAERD